MRFLGLTVWLLFLPALSACEVTFLSISTDGRLEITVVTNGSTVDLDGYSVTIDGTQARPVDANGTITLSQITEGTHVVQLSEVDENCSVQGDNPRTVVVPSGKTFTVSFVVACQPRRLGL
jgi:hypothetical protein